MHFKLLSLILAIPLILTCSEAKSNNYNINESDKFTTGEIKKSNSFKLEDITINISAYIPDGISIMLIQGHKVLVTKELRTGLSVICLDCCK